MMDSLRHLVFLFEELDHMNRQKNELEDKINRIKNQLKEIKDFDKMYHEMRQKIWEQIKDLGRDN